MRIHAHGFWFLHVRCVFQHYFLIVADANQSVVHSLHTATLSLFAPLLRYHLTCASPEGSYTLIRRVMTALIHHCKDAQQFAPIADRLVEQFVTCVESPANEEQLRRILEVATVACSVRQGSRLSCELYPSSFWPLVLTSR